MDIVQTRELLFGRFIEPTRSERPHYAGVEIELPIVNLSGSGLTAGSGHSDSAGRQAAASTQDAQPVDHAVVHSLTKAFGTRFGFVVSKYDDDGHIAAVTDPETGDILTYDCSYNNLELSFGCSPDLLSIQSRLDGYLGYIQRQLGRSNHLVTGMGTNPHHHVNPRVPIPTGRYRMLYHHLLSTESKPSPRYFHGYPHYGMMTSATQIQLDVDFGRLLDTIATFNLLQPYLALLLANSPFVDADIQYLCARDMFWEHSMQGYNLHNIGMFEQLPKSLDELLDYLSTLSIYCTERDGHYLNFPPTPIADFLAADSIRGEYYCGDSYRQMEFAPSGQDLPYLRSYKFTDLTFRGTVEHRSICTQPLAEGLCGLALLVGLSEPGQMEQLREALDADAVLFGHGFTATELRRLLVVCHKDGLPGFIDRAALRKQLLTIVALADRGLKARGKGEGALLQPLFDRAERLDNPALEQLRRQRAGLSPEQTILDFAAL